MINMLRKKIKFIPQMTSFDCGPSCLAMIMHYYGLAVQASEIRNSKIINKKSAWSLLDIKKLVNRMNSLQLHIG